MRFPTWLWEQLDAGNSVSKFAKLCWDDVNNGCAHPTFNATQWLAHFEEKHKDSRDTLVSLMLPVYQEYMLSCNPK
jgi:hypothetical protein